MNLDEQYRRVGLAHRFNIETRETDGFLKFKELKEFKISFFLYRKNYIELNKCIREYYSSPDNLHTNSMKRWYRQQNLIRNFHNVLFSARVLVEKHWMDDVLKDSFHCFMKELRNFITHQNYLPLTSRIKLNTEIELQFETIQIAEFNDYLKTQIAKYPKRCGLKLAQEYLKNIEGELNLNELLADYNQKLNRRYRAHIKNHLLQNSESFNNLITRFDEFTLDNSFTPTAPLTKPQIRYLRWNLRKLQNP